MTDHDGAAKWGDEHSDDDPSRSPGDIDAGHRALVDKLRREALEERAAREEAERVAERELRRLRQANHDLEGRVAERTAELRRSLAAVTMAAESRERFLADLGGQLTSPLRALPDALGLIDTKGLDIADRERLADARDAARRLAELLRALVDLAGAEAAAQPDDVRDRNPASWLDEVVATWTRRSAKRGLMLVPSVTASGGSVTLDWKRLRTITDAVLENVLAHTTPGGVSIDLTVEPNQVALVVTDAGPGMSEEQLATAFEPFVAFGDTGGVGIGLTIADRLAVTAGGSITLLGEAGATSAVVALPRPT